MSLDDDIQAASEEIDRLQSDLDDAKKKKRDLIRARKRADNVALRQKAHEEIPQVLSVLREWADNLDETFVLDVASGEFLSEGWRYWDKQITDPRDSSRWPVGELYMKMFHIGPWMAWMQVYVLGKEVFLMLDLSDSNSYRRGKTIVDQKILDVEHPNIEPLYCERMRTYRTSGVSQVAVKAAAEIALRRTDARLRKKYRAGNTNQLA